MFITTAVETPLLPRAPTELIRSIIIVVGEDEGMEDDIARDLMDSLSDFVGVHTRFLSLKEAVRETDLASRFLIFLDHRSVFLDSLTEKTWPQLQSLLLSARDLLWITAAGGANPNPGYGLLDGFSKVLRSEHYDMHLVTLALDLRNSHRREKTRHIMQIVEEMVTTPVGQNYEQDYIEIDGMLHIKRVVEATYVRSALETQLAPYNPGQVRRSEAPPFELRSRGAGPDDSLCYKQSHDSTNELQPGMVEIEVMAVSLDRGDYNTTLGRNDEDRFGSFFAGITLRVGSDVTIQPGAHVFGWCHGSFRSHVVTAASLVAELPLGFTFRGACASIPQTLAAHYALVEEGRLRSNDRVLIHNGASQAGEAAIKLCQELGVKQLWATATSEEERNHLVNTFELSDENVLPATLIDRHIAERAPNNAIDIVLAADFNLPELQSLSYIRPRGRYIQLHSTSGGSNELPRLLNIPSSMSLSQLEFRDILEEDPAAIRDSLEYSIKHASMEADTSLPHYSISQLSEIFEHLRGCGDGERVIVDFNTEEAITVSVHFLPWTNGVWLTHRRL